MAGGSLVLEAAGGSIGGPADADKLYIDLEEGATLTARARDDIYIVERGGRMMVRLDGRKAPRAAAAPGVVDEACGRGARVLVHVVAHSKTGVHAPTLEAVVRDGALGGHGDVVEQAEPVGEHLGAGDGVVPRGADQRVGVVDRAFQHSLHRLDHAAGGTGLGVLQAAAAMGRDDFRRCLVFHSLSKRSNAPGLRSGFVAGDAAALARYRLYRTYHGCAMPPATQAASIAAWRDEDHVRQTRERYRARFDAVLPVLGEVLDVARPDGAFYLWAGTPIDDERFCRELYRRQHVTLLPGSYLSRPTAAGDPGRNRVRLSLVASLDDCVEAAERIRHCCRELT